MSGLEPFRRRLDEIDGELVRLLGERFAVCRDVAAYKGEHEIPMMQPDRVTAVEDRYRSGGERAALPAAFTDQFVKLLISATCDMEDELIGSPSSPTVDD